ncbi:MAG: tol-pal system protein YbgF [Pseudomonadota bacterium]
MKRSALVIVATLLAAGCATEPQVDPVKLRLDDLDSRVGRIDRVVSNDSLVQMSNRIEAQQQEIRQLHGQLEELQNDNTKLRKEQRDLYADIDKRLADASTAAASAAEAAKSAAATNAANVPPAAAGDEQTLYNRALDQLKSRDYAAATESFRSLAAQYPNGQLADNTQYWLGEAYYVTQEYDHAMAAFQRVLANWPNSRKAPDALLKVGYTQIEQGKVPVGKATLEQLVAKYPGSDAAKLATERLAKLPKQ